MVRASSVGATEIVVVGAGPTGLTLAGALLRQGVGCRVVERSGRLPKRSRAIAESLRLEWLGGAVERGVCLRELRQDPGQEGVSLVLEGPDGRTVSEASWVVGADGRDSAVRHLAGIGFEAVTGDMLAAERFRVGRCLLVGDAAHLHDGGVARGPGNGIGDARSLAWRLALVAGAWAEEQLLDDYEAERRPLHGGGTFREPGRRIPNAPLVGMTGSERLLDLLGRRPLTVLALGVGHDDSAALTRLAGTLRAAYGDALELCAVESSATVTAAVPAAVQRHPMQADAGRNRMPTAVDHDGILHDWLDITEPTVCLLRADGYMAYTGPLSTPSGLLDHLGHALGLWRLTDYPR